MRISIGLAYLCVDIDAVEGVSGIINLFFEDEGGIFSRFEDEYNIVGKANIENGEKKKHMGIFLPSA